MTRCDTCGKNLDQMEVQSVQTDNGDFCLTCAGREIDRLHKIEANQRWRKFPEEKPLNSSMIAHQVIIGPDPGKNYLSYTQQAIYTMDRWFLDELRSDDDVTDRVTHFRPVGDLPAAGGE